MSRENLKEARKNKRMTQQTVADYSGISLRYYQQIEAGHRNGDCKIWDALEDLFSIHQRILRHQQHEAVHHDQKISKNIRA